MMDTILNLGLNDEVVEILKEQETQDLRMTHIVDLSKCSEMCCYGCQQENF